MKLNDIIKDFEQKDKMLVQRAIDTIYGNIITKPNDASSFVFKDYRGIAPSPATYKGVWNWDSAFHLMAMSYLEPEIGYDQIRILFEFMKEDGQLADVIFTTGKTVFKFTKPPVIAYSIMCSDRVVPNDTFLNYCYPYLLRNLEWWEKNRFDGILFSYKVNKCESGWDNTPRFDFPHKIDNCYAIDCNSFMVSYYDALEYIAKRINITDRYKEFTAKKETLIKNINAKLYSKRGNYYCDYDKKLKCLTRRLSPASFMPLYYGFASKEQAQAMSELASNPKYFYKGIPTISYNNFSFDENRYWRGPCWLNTSYFTIRGLSDYGYKDLAKELAQNLLDWCTINADSIYEYYNPITGKGLGAKNFGWSCTFIIELVLLKYEKNVW
jgi:putative isomerase